MTIRRSLALSFLLILGLFAVNIGVYYWSNGRRTESLQDLRRATLRASLASSLDRQVEDRQREMALLGQLALDMGSASLSSDQVTAVRSRIDAIDQRMRQLEESSEPAAAQTVKGITSAYAALRTAWLELFDAIANGADAPVPTPGGRRDRAAVAAEPDAATPRIEQAAQRTEALSAALGRLLAASQAQEDQRVDWAAEHSLQVERLTNRAAFGMFGLSLVVSLLVAWRLVTRVNKGLAALKYGAEKLGSGDLDYRIPVHASDEFGALGEAFNGMAGNLREARHEILSGQEQLRAELSEAASYVHSLLPKPLGGQLSSHWRFVPSAQLGGDAFGHEWLDDDHLAIFLLDVCGHGVGSAMLSISVMNVLRSRTLPYVDFRDPAAVLAGLNAAFPMEQQSDRFFTIWYGVFHRTTRELVYASGGHPPAVLLDRAEDGHPRVSELTTNGMIIGVMDDARFTTKRHAVEGLGKLYLFSDGIYEVSSASGTILPFRDFVACLLQSHAQKPSALDATLSQIRRSTRRDFFDDDVSIVEVVFGTDPSGAGTSAQRLM